MVLPMAVLGMGAAVAGLAGSPWMHQVFFSVLGVHEAHGGIDVPILLLSTLAAGSGIALAWIVGFRRRQLLPVGLRPLGARLYDLASHKYFIDELYGACIIQPFLRMTQALARFDQQVIDGAVNGAGRLGWRAGQWKEWFDRRVIDGAVNGLARTIRGAGASLRRVQTGIIQQYLFVIVASAVILSLWLRS
jgi:NADH-quinone oxidoreductase subunit L